MVQDAVGEWLPPNRIVYRDAFDRLAADVVYTYRKSGLEQDVILRESPPDPETFGLVAEATRLEVLSEFFAAPTPAKRVRLLDRVEDPALRAAMAEPDWVDEELDFGPLRMAQGRALSLSDWLEGRPVQAPIPVGKRWVNQDGRTLLFEGADYWALAVELGQLPPSDRTPRRPRQGALDQADRHQRMAGLILRDQPKHVIPRTLPSRSATTAAVPRPQTPGPDALPTPAIQVATLALDAQPGVVLDYATVSGTKTDYVFRADTTYWVTGPATMAGSTVRFEGGTVIKFSAGVGAKIAVDAGTRVLWGGGLHRPVVFTAKDDHGVGQKIGSATAFSGPYATTALELTYHATYGSFNLPWLRIAYAQNGLSVNGGTGHAFRHLQIVQCDKGIVGLGSATYAVRNGLFQGVTKALSGAGTVTAEHLTVNGGALRDNGQPTVTLKNSLLTGVSDVGTGYGADSQVLASAGGVFQSVQQGAHYLASDSPYRNWPAALTTLDSTLLSDLRQLTTYPPVTLTADFTASTTLSPQAQRDTDTLDLGYHYAPLDYLLSARTLNSGCTLLLTNGVAVAAYGNRLLSLASSTAKLVSEGTPSALNRLTLIGAAQEQPTLTAAPTYLASGTYPQIALRFTSLSLPGGQKLVTDGGFSGTIGLQDCQVAGLYWYVYNWYQWGYSPTVSFKNNLLESCTLNFEQGYAGTPATLHLTLRNNLLSRAPLTLWYSSAYYGTWELYDGLFDAPVSVTAGTIPAAYNGFIGLAGPGNWSQNKNNLSRDFVSGPLGGYYYPPSGAYPSLASLIDADPARTPASVGLYHYTTVTATGTKEAATLLDIGFHYVGVDASQTPLDYDGDTLADYFEDRNGNGGAPDSGETNWQVSENGTSGVPGLRVFSPRE